LINKKNFGQKLISWSKLDILAKLKFWLKSKFGSKMEILVENVNGGQKLILWPKIKIICQKSIFWSKIEIFSQKRDQRNTLIY